MTPSDACRQILGCKTADAIIADQGVHWAVVAAMAAATTRHDLTAVEALREYVSIEKGKDELHRDNTRV